MEIKHIQIPNSDMVFEGLFEKPSAQLASMIKHKVLLLGPDTIFPRQETTVFDMFPPVRYDGVLEGHEKLIFTYGDVDGKTIFILAEKTGNNELTLSHAPGEKSTYKLSYSTEEKKWVWTLVEQTK